MTVLGLRTLLPGVLIVAGVAGAVELPGKAPSELRGISDCVRANAPGGTMLQSMTLTTIDPEQRELRHLHPDVLPNLKGVLFTERPALGSVGDSRLAVVTITNLQPGSEFRVLLIPKRDDRPLPATATRDLQVTVQGKNAASSWITSMPASFNDRLSTGGLMAPICVPTTQGADDYYYMITVDEVGVLDPRARVN